VPWSLLDSQEFPQPWSCKLLWMPLVVVNSVDIFRIFTSGSCFALRWCLTSNDGLMLVMF
jgi:hypothetical protein